jgi:ATP-dependent helicase Lhr and Lhr-like helicase
VLGAVWDLAWAGLVTNDTFAALRFLGEHRPRRGGARRGGSGAPARPTGPDGDVDGGAPHAARRRLPGGWWRGSDARGSDARGSNARGSNARGSGRARATGPGGRWSLVRDLVRDPVNSTERAHSWAATLLDRHAIVARETAGVEALGGGFGGIYSVLRSMEDAGRVRRGYFVEGLGGAQFAYPGIIDRLRRERDAPAEGVAVALAAADPANPYGWLLPWPDLAGDTGTGAARGARRAATALRSVARSRPGRTLALEQIGGDPALRSPLGPVLREAGFTQDYRYLRLRAD